MSLFGYLLAGGAKGAGDALTAKADEAKRKAREDKAWERRQQERIQDRMWRKEDQADDRSYRESWRDEGRSYDATRRSEQTSANSGALGAVYGKDPRVNVRPGTLGSLLMKHESGSFDTLFGHSQNEGGKFAGVRVSEMTLGELAEFSNVNGEYGQTVKGQVGRVATPMGIGQIVGTTMRQTAKEMGLPPETKFTPKVQMQMVEHLAKKAVSGPRTAAGKRQALRGVWEGFKSASDAELDQAIAAFERGDLGIDYVDQNAGLVAAAANPDVDSTIQTKAMQELERRTTGPSSVKLTGEEWVSNDDGTETRYGQDDKGNLRPYMIEGRPYTRKKDDKPEKLRSLNSSEANRISDYVVNELGYNQREARLYLNEVERLLNEDKNLTPISAFELAMQNTKFAQETRRKGFMGLGGEETVDGPPIGFDYGNDAQPPTAPPSPAPAVPAAPPPAPTGPRRGLDPMADDAPTMPTGPRRAPAPGGPGAGTPSALPRPKSKAERDALPPGSRYIAPDGTVMVRK